MFRPFLWLFPGVCLCLSVHAQNPPAKPGKPVTPPVTTPPVANPVVPGQAPLMRIKTDLSDTANENKLVLLALQGPEYDETVHQGRINELEVKRAKMIWLNLLSVSTQYNDQSFKNQGQVVNGQTYVYPKYFFGITIPLGVIFSQSNTVKAARESESRGKDQQEIMARTIRTNVLTKYKQYKLYTSLIEMETEVINDVQANFAQAEDNFRKGTITVDSYIGAQRLKNDELTKTLNLQLQQDLLRIDLERMIGVPLDQVLYPIRVAPLYR